MIGRSEHYIAINISIVVLVVVVLVIVAIVHQRRRFQRIDAGILAVLKESPGLSAQNIRARLRDDKGLYIGYQAIYGRMEMLHKKKKVTRWNVRTGQSGVNQNRILYK
jgi:hypothetical protein